MIPKPQAVEPGVAQGAVKIRTPRYTWMWYFAFGAFWLVLSVFYAWLDRPWQSWGYLATGCLWVAGGLLIRNLGVDLTPVSANFRSPRRRSVPWSEVQAVARQKASGVWCVQLILENEKPVTLRAPTSMWGLGGAEYERDFDRIGQWWLAHRGESWRPLRPEAPRLHVQE